MGNNFIIKTFIIFYLLLPERGADEALIKIYGFLDISGSHLIIALSSFFNSFFYK